MFLMRQPSKRDNKKNKIAPTKRTVKKTVVRKKTVRKHPQYGTSKLEEDFAREFLDKLKLKFLKGLKN